MKMKVFTHMLSLGRFSTSCEEMKEELGLKGTGSSQTAVRPAKQPSVKGKLETAAPSSLPGLASPEGKKNLFVPLINSSFLPVSRLHLSWRKLVNILFSSPSASVNFSLISDPLVISTFVTWVFPPPLSLLNSSPCHSFPLTAPAEGPCHPRQWPRSCCMQGTLWVPGAAHLLELDTPSAKEAEVCCPAGFPAWFYSALALWG